MPAVRVLMVSARRVLNLTSPRYLAELALAWPGKRPWHDARYEPLRDLVEAHYVERFNNTSGHYRRLEESVVRLGVQNPVMLTTGRLMVRKPGEVPPDWDIKKRPVCEWVGGSRLWVAARLNIDIPAIVNDYADLYSEAPLVTDSTFRSLFRDPPRVVRWRNDGSVYANYLTYSHFDDMAQRRAARRNQTPLRRQVIAEILHITTKWLESNDG